MADGLPPLLVFADDWGRHPSSCQHLIRRLRDDCTVLWVNSIGTRQVRADALTFRRGWEKLRGWSQGLRQVADRMWVVDLPMLPGLGTRWIRGLNRALVTTYLKWSLARLGIERPVVLTTLPYIDWLIRGLRRRSLVYYCTDDYSHWPSADRDTLIQADRELTSRADLILAASRALYNSHEYTGRCQLFPHGVDFEHFASAQRLEAAPAVTALPGRRIGFFGLLYEKIDYTLLTALASRFPAASLAMIGPVAYCPPDFASLPNVHLLGQQPYEKLPGFLAGLDVLLMPYVNDEMIRQSGPLKLRECLASGKPTVGIDIPDLRAYQPHVRIGATQEGFLEQVGQALEEPPDQERAQARQAAVRRDGWDARAARLRTWLGSPAGSASNGALARRAPERRVLHLRTISGKGGGPEKTLLNSPRFLAGRYALRLLYIRPEGDAEYDMPARARQLGVDLVDLPEKGAIDLGTVRAVAREIAEFRPHILHPHDYKTNVLAAILGRWYDVPVVTTLHGYVTRTPKLDWYYAIDRLALRHLDHVIVVSEDLYQGLIDEHFPRSRFSVIENAIDAEQYRRRRPAAEAREALLGRATRRVVIGAAGRLSAEKGFDHLIRSVQRLVDGGHDVELVIAGEGDERPRLEQLIVELGCADRAHLLGHQTDPRGFYEALDLFVLSSLREGLPNVLLEAMAMEVPVVATAIAGVPRVVADGVSGLLVPPGSVEGLTEALGRLVPDPALRGRLAQAGRRTVEERFSFAARMEKVRAVYDKVLASRGPCPLSRAVTGCEPATRRGALPL